MPESGTVSARHVEILETYRDGLDRSDRTLHLSVATRIYEVEMEESGLDLIGDPFDYQPSIFELLESIAHYSLKDQATILCNLLTTSGFTQGEIAEAMGITHQSYRNRILALRKDLRDRTA